MTKLEEAKEFLNLYGGIGDVKDDIKDGYTQLDELLVDYSKHIISKLIDNIKANEDKPVKLIIEYLEGLL